MSDQPGPPTPPAPGLTSPSAPLDPEAPAWGSPASAPPPPPVVTPYTPYGVPAQYQQNTGTETHQGALWSMILGIIGLVSAVLALPTSGITALGMACSPV